jgi:magnesium-transporting ATPase (P-type)
MEMPLIFKELDSSKSGLTGSEVQARLSEFGSNKLPQKPPAPIWKIFIRQFGSPLIYILVFAAAISIVIKEPTDAAFIMAVLILNAIIGGYQEYKAEKSSQALQKLLQIKATVLRDGEVSEIIAENLVPGDVVWLESGNRVPADIRLLTTRGLEVDESLLTGESLPVLKDEYWKGEVNTEIADRLNIAHAGSIVTRGRAKGMVVSTGLSTAVGLLALDIKRVTGGEPPLVLRMKRFAHVITVAILMSSFAIWALNLIMARYDITEMLLVVVALAVAAIPEGLPVAMTVALAIATTRMAKRGVIVRRLTAVEGMGSCTYIATDKTGTVTRNELTVKEVYLYTNKKFQVTGSGFTPEGEVLLDGKPIDRISNPEINRVAKAAVLCNEADLHRSNGGWHWRGDTVDVALLSFGQKLGYNRDTLLDLYPQINQIPFEPELQFSASYNKVDAESVKVFVKGAPEKVLEMCEFEEEIDRINYLSAVQNMAERGYRVLALAEGEFQGDLDYSMIPPEPSDLLLLGFVGMIDPLRTEVPEAVKRCQEAGVAVSMVTGDHSVTALAIARDMGLATDISQVVKGSELIGKSEESMKSIVAEKKVFARVTPHQKLQIVKAARELGHFVAVTGDGVNDAPALRQANIGVSMGKEGTDVAREASDLVISDDNFATIIAGIEEGRVAYNNIRNVVYLLISTGAAELVLVALSVIMGLPLPLLPVQILWLNLITSGIQDVALAFEPGEDDILKKKPRSPDEKIFNRLMIERTIIGALTMGFVGFGFFYFMLENGWSEYSARNALLLLMVLFENVHVGNCRSETKSALVLSPFKSPILLIGVLIAFLIHVCAMYLPLGQKVLQTEPIQLNTWILLLILSLTIFITMEIHKWFWAHRYNSIKESHGLTDH